MEKKTICFKVVKKQKAESDDPMCLNLCAFLSMSVYLVSNVK